MLFDLVGRAVDVCKMQLPPVRPGGEADAQHIHEQFSREQGRFTYPYPVPVRNFEIVYISMPCYASRTLRAMPRSDRHEGHRLPVAPTLLTINPALCHLTMPPTSSHSRNQAHHGSSTDKSSLWRIGACPISHNAILAIAETPDRRASQQSRASKRAGHCDYRRWVRRGGMCVLHSQAVGIYAHDYHPRSERGMFRSHGQKR